MTKFSPEYLNLADDLLKQFALAGDDNLSAILNKNNIASFQTQYTGGRVHRFPPVKTITLFMHQVASCNTPEMVRKEIDVHLLVYNLIRALMARSVVRLKNKPREISFKAAQECLQEFHMLLLQSDVCLLQRLVEYMVSITGEHRVGNRPGRHERSKDDQSLTNGSSTQEHKRAD